MRNKKIFYTFFLIFAFFAQTVCAHGREELQKLNELKEQLRQEKIARVNDKIAGYNRLKSLEMQVYSFEDKVSDLKTEKFSLEEELNALGEVKVKIQDEYINLDNTAKNIRDFLNDKIEDSKEKIRNSFPLHKEERLKEVNLVINLSDFLNFLEREIQLTETLEFYKDKINGQDVEILRIGNIFAAYRSGTGELGLLEKKYKKGRIIRRWNKNLPSSLQKKLNQIFVSFKKRDKNLLVLPVDVTQGARYRVSEESGGAIVGWIIKGGPVMIPIGLLLLGIIIMSVERLLAFKKEHTDADLLMNKIMNFWQKGDEKEAIKLCENTPGPVARMLKIGLEQQRKGKKVVEEMFHEQHLEEIPRLQKHLSTIGVLAGVAPLLGLLGTVSGMISTFRVITYHGGGDPRLLAGGISEALITTEAGLIIAIPALLIHNYLSNRAEKIAADMEKNAVKFVNSLCEE